MDVELVEVRDFLAQHAPFDTLPAHVLEQVPRHCTMSYARRGTVVVDVGGEGKGLYVVRSGVVEVVDELGGLIERIGPGIAFGMSALLDGVPSRHRCTATEDTLLILLTAAHFAALARDHLPFASYYAATHHARLSRAIRQLQQASTGISVLSTPARDLITRPPVIASPEDSVAAAAGLMSEASVSSILVVGPHGIEGIMTDRDLRNRVVAQGGDLRQSVRKVMTADPVTLRDGAAAFEAMLLMVDHNIHHLPLVDAIGTPVGVVSTTDLLRREGINPIYMAADIARQKSLDDVVVLARQIPRVLGRMVDRDASAADISRVLTAVGDAVRRRVLALVEQDLGAPPVSYSWVVLGSAAREEEALAADQDHALVLAESGHDEWFSKLANKVTDVLEQAGWPRCPGEVMATNPQWRLTVEQWRSRFRAWSSDPDSESVLQVAIFHDMRHLAGDEDLTRAVRRAASTNVSPRLLGHLGADALRTRPPLGFFRGFVLEQEGEHRDTLDLKRGLAALVQLARVHALQIGSTALGTRSRIEAAQDAGLMDADSAADLLAAWELMSYRRLHHQVTQVRAGEAVDNRIAPAELSERERRHLRDAFAIVRSAQQLLANRLGPGYL